MQCPIQPEYGSGDKHYLQSSMQTYIKSLALPGRFSADSSCSLVLQQNLDRTHILENPVKHKNGAVFHFKLKVIRKKYIVCAISGVISDRSDRRPMISSWTGRPLMDAGHPRLRSRPWISPTRPRERHAPTTGDQSYGVTRQISAELHRQTTELHRQPIELHRQPTDDSGPFTVSLPMTADPPPSAYR